MSIGGVTTMLLPMTVSDDSVWRAKDTTDQLVDVLMDDVVVRRLSRVPEFEASFEKLSDGEQDDPARSGELRCGNGFPRRAADFCKHGYPEEPVDLVIVESGSPEHIRVE